MRLGQVGAAILLMCSAPASSRAWQVDPALLEACPILQTAIDQAVAIAEGPLGVDCYVNGPLDNGQDPSNFTMSDNGPEIQVSNARPGCNGWYFPVGPGDPRRNIIFLNEQLKLDAADGDTAAFEVLVSSLLHETAHWVDNVVDGADTPGEEGDQMEVWLFGIDVERENANGALGTACPVAPPGTLALSLEPLRPAYLIGEPIEILVTLTNQSGGQVSLLDLFEIEGSYLTLDIVDRSSGQRVDYTGIETDPAVTVDLVADLGPGQSLQHRVQINAFEAGYALDQPGIYDISGTYEVPNYNCPFFGRTLFRGQALTQAPVTIGLFATPIPALGSWGLALAALLLLLVYRARD